MFATTLYIRRSCFGLRPLHGAVRSVHKLGGGHLSNTAMVFKDPWGQLASKTYADLSRDAQRVAANLTNNGKISFENKTVAVYAPNSYEYQCLQWGIWQAGGIFVPLCVTHPRKELEYFVADSKADTLFCHWAHTPVMASLAEQMRLRFLTMRSLCTLSDESDTHIEALVNPPSDSRATIVYTSGTTGRPKGVVSTHGQLTAQAASMIGPWGWSPDDRILHCLPLHHVHGIVNALYVPAVVGATVEMMEKFDANAVWQRWCDTSLPPITLFFGVPTMYAKLIQEFDKQNAATQHQWTKAASRLRLMVSGSAALPTSVMRRWRDVSGHTLLERYGMTEIGMALSNPLTMDGPEGGRIEGSVGFPMPGVECKIGSLTNTSEQDLDNDYNVDHGGPLLVKGETVFREYWNRPDATTDAFDSQGWFKTGDVAHKDENGRFWILGRASVDIIKASGYKISALEVERELLEHPQIDEVAVIGIDDETKGQAVVAVVVLSASNTETDLDIATLRSWGKERIAAYKLPSKVVIVNEIPRNAMGKVNKVTLRSHLFPQT